jgi:glycosyltransferase involved in cell wall biosynthesis
MNLTFTAIKNPTWIGEHNFSYEKYDEIEDSVFERINHNLNRIIGENPLITILIAAWNEEINILRCISSISKTEFPFPIEIIVVNNNSKDRTQDTLDRLNVKSLFEEKQGCGPARGQGQLMASGKYILLADADCFYPPCWVNDMHEVLKEKNIVCVYGRYSFISEVGFPRWKLYIYERLKDIIAEFRQLNRPYFNAYGISMGYIRDLGIKVGFIQNNFWGDDGQLCLGLMKFGKVKPVRSNRARAWTGTRTLQRNGNSFSQALWIRITKEIKRFFGNFNNKLPKDAYHKTS